jgi:hypothetical protein
MNVERSWYRFAELFLTNKLELAEIVKFWVIGTEVKLLDDERNVQRIGYNIIDKSDLNDGLVLGAIFYISQDRFISYEQIGQIIKYSPRTIASSIKRLLEENYISKLESTSEGTRYSVPQEPKIPLWMLFFTKALVDLYYDHKLKGEIAEECSSIQFQRGFQVLRRELKEKYGHSSHQDE